MLRSLSLTSTNALEHFDSIEQQMRGRSLLLLLDYDGTLSPIVSDPTKVRYLRILIALVQALPQAYMPEDTRAVLREITRYHTTGIITGRSLEKVSQFVDMDNLIYAGSHGFDIRGPHNTDIHHQVCEVKSREWCAPLIVCRWR
jgi:trehalose 6-phosphate phosphatase